MKKFLKILIFVAVMSVGVVSAQSSIIFKNNSDSIEIIPSVGGKKYKLYYQWVKVEKTSGKEIDNLYTRLNQLNEQYENLNQQLNEISEAKNDLNNTQHRLDSIKNQKTQIINDYNATLTHIDTEISNIQTQHNNAKTCFYDSGCQSTFTSEAQLNQHFESLKDQKLIEKQKVDSEHQRDINTIDAVISDYEAKIIVYNNKISEEENINQSLSFTIQNLEQLQGQIGNLTKYNDTEWKEIDGLIIKKPVSSSEKDYALWVKLVTNDGETIYASYLSKSVSKKNFTSSNSANISKSTANQKIKNPKTADKGFIYGGSATALLGVIIAVRKKLKMIGI